MNTNFFDSAVFMVQASNWEFRLKSWIMERLDEERQKIRLEVDHRKNELGLVIQQRVTSMRDLLKLYASSWENSKFLIKPRTVLDDRTASDLGERLREVERGLTKLRKENGGMEEMKRRLAKMEEDCAQERMEAVKRENLMRTVLDKYIVQMEEERARERKDMEKRESERKREMTRYMAQVEEETARERKDKEKMYREIQAKIARVENRSSEKLTKAAGDELTNLCPVMAARAQSEPSNIVDDHPVNSERRKRGFFRRLFGKRIGKQS